MGSNSDVLLSIIIPHYNSPHLLRRLLDTIPNDENLEVIVVDDRSDKYIDEYEACKKEYGDARHIFIRNEGLNKGAGASRNVGLSNAKGKWVIFADSDDIFLKDFYEAVSINVHLDEDIIYFIPTSKNEKGEDGVRHIEFANYAKNFHDKPSASSELHLRYRYTGPWSKLISREMLVRNGILFDEIRFSNDVMFSVKAAYAARTVKVEMRSIYCIMETEGSLTTVETDEAAEMRTKVLIDRYCYLKDRLDKEKFKELDLSALGRILLSIKSRNTSVKSDLKIVKMIIKSRMRIIPRRIFTIGFWKSRFVKS